MQGRVDRVESNFEALPSPTFPSPEIQDDDDDEHANRVELRSSPNFKCPPPIARLVPSVMPCGPS